MDPDVGKRPFPEEDRLPIDDMKAFTFNVGPTEEPEELFHITYEGKFVFAPGVEIEPAARRFAQYFHDEITKIKLENLQKSLDAERDELLS